jgi:hypothetical protein
MKTIEFLQKIGITNVGGAAGSDAGSRKIPDGLMTDVSKSPKDSSSKQDPDPSLA